MLYVIQEHYLYQKILARAHGDLLVACSIHFIPVGFIIQPQVIGKQDLHLRRAYAQGLFGILLVVLIHHHVVHQVTLSVGFHLAIEEAESGGVAVITQMIALDIQVPAIEIVCRRFACLQGGPLFSGKGKAI